MLRENGEDAINGEEPAKEEGEMNIILLRDLSKRTRHKGLSLSDAEFLSKRGRQEGGRGVTKEGRHAWGKKGVMRVRAVSRTEGSFLHTRTHEDNKTKKTHAGGLLPAKESGKAIVFRI